MALGEEDQEVSIKLLNSRLNLICLFFPIKPSFVVYFKEEEEEEGNEKKVSKWDNVTPV